MKRSLCDIQLSSEEQKRYDELINLWSGKLTDAEVQMLEAELKIRSFLEQVRKQKNIIKQLKHENI